MFFSRQVTPGTKGSLLPARGRASFFYGTCRMYSGKTTIALIPRQ